MRMTIRFRFSRFLLVVASILLIQGLIALEAPALMDLPASDPLRNWVAVGSMLLISGAASIITVRRRHLARPLVYALNLLPVAGLLVLAYGCVHMGRWDGVVLCSTAALALLLFPWLAESDDDGAYDLFLVVQVVAQGLTGLWLLVAPDSFGFMDQALLRPFLPLLGLVGLLGAAIWTYLLLRPASPWRPALMLVGAVLPLSMVFVDGFRMLWANLHWALWILAMALPAGYRGPLVKPEVHLSPPGDRTMHWRSQERLLEVWGWMLIALVILLSAIPGPLIGLELTVVQLFVLLLTLYQVLVHWLLERVGRPEHRLLLHLGALTLLVGYLMHAGGVLGASLVALLVMTAPLATQIAGRVAGTVMMGFALMVTLAAQVMGYLHGDVTADEAAVATLVQWLMLAVASWIGVSIAEAQRTVQRELETSRAEVTRQVETLELLLQIAHSVRRSLDLGEVLHQAVTQLGQALRVNRAFIRLRKSDTSVPVVSEYLQGDHLSLTAIPLPPSLVMQNRQRSVIDDLERLPSTAPELRQLKQALQELGVRSSMAVPILVDDEVLGVIAVHDCEGPRQWQPHEVLLLEQLASQAGVAIALAQSHESLQRHFEELQETYHHLHVAFNQLSDQDRQLLKLNDALRASEERYAHLLEIAPNAIIAFDAQQRIVLFNRAAVQVFGYTEAEALGQPMAVLIPDRFHRHHPQLVEGFDPYPETSRLIGQRSDVWGRRKDGSEFPAEIAIARFMLHGETYYTAVVQDVTGRRETERVLRQSEERFRSAFDNAPIGVALYDLTWDCRQVNRAFAELVGYAPAELQATTIDQILHPEDRALVLSRLHRLTQGVEPSLRLEMRLLHRSGAVVWVDQSFSLVPDTGGGLHVIAQALDISDRRRYEAELIHLANHDPLTGLANRRHFEEMVEKHLVLSRNFDLPGAILFLDLDHFKYVNDTLGHRAGDELLRLVATTLRMRLGPTDLIARLGGDEFAVLLIRPWSEAVPVARQLLEALRQPHHLTGGQRVTLTGSVGISYFPAEGMSAEDLLAQADMAMYQAKEGGRDGSAVFTDGAGWREEMARKLSWERRIREALRDDRFVLHYQPILDLHQGRITHHEVLIRMVNDDGSKVLPGEFLGIAERFGLIQPIDRWVVRRAIQLLAEHRDRGEDLVFEVNLSGKTISDPGLLPLIQQELRRTGVNPANLVFEVTETAAISDLAQARRFVDAMKHLGCRFALDDVGAGFSSLTLIKHLPVDYIKIDGAFIQNLTSDRADQHLVQALVKVAQELGKKTIAEFVDSDETLALLRSYGVDFAQGYLIGRPAEVLVH